METEILTIDDSRKFQQAVDLAASLLRSGQLVAIPTETVYGLAADALNPAAVQKIYEVKGRPAQNPLIVHIPSLEMARQCVTQWPQSAEILARKFWPGPITFVLPKSKVIPDIITAGGPTVALRWPNHPFSQAIIARLNSPVAAPSANLSSQISPTNAQHVWRSLAGKIPLIIDAGQSQIGIESTVLDLTNTEPRILRPGMISREQIAQVLGSVVAQGGSTTGALKSPGLLERHYAPQTKMVLLHWRNEKELLEQAASFGLPLSQIHVICHDHIPSTSPFGRVSIIPFDAEAYSRALYAELHQSDNSAAQLIIVEELPDSPIWEGLRDRLKRASR